MRRYRSRLSRLRAAILSCTSGTTPTFSTPSPHRPTALAEKAHWTWRPWVCRSSASRPRSSLTSSMRASAPLSCGYKKCFPSLRHHSAAPARQRPRCICALCAIARAANVCQILFLPLSFTHAEKACAGCAYMLKYQQYGYNYIAVMLLYSGGRRQLAALCLRRALVKENRK